MNEYELVALLIEKKLHITAGESCTGGLFAATLVNVPDASNVLSESYVTYANESKIKLLGVKPETINNFGVVSENVAAEMAAGAAKAAGAEVALGVTGYAGPSGGDEFSARGTVCLGFYVCGRAYTHTVFRPDMERNELRSHCVSFAVDMLGQYLQNA